MQPIHRPFSRVGVLGAALSLAAFPGLDASHAAMLQVGGAGATAATLSGALALASDGDTILVEPGLYPEVVTTSKAVAILADGAAGSVILDGSSVSSVLTFQSVAGPVALEGLLIRNGEGVRGGGLRLDGVQGGVSLLDCRFEGNIASVSGGAIDAFDAVVEIQGCEFENNVTAGSSEQRGGAISLRNGASGSSIVTSLFTENSAEFGGAVWFSGVVTLGECTFVENSATRGGAVYSNDAVTPTITHCAFLRNAGGEYGGAVFLSGNGGDIRWTTFEENQCTDCTGGALYAAGGSALTVHHCLFRANSAAHGGAAGAAAMLESLEYSTFHANVCSVDGADFFANQASPRLALDIFASPVGASSVHLQGAAAPEISCNVFHLSGPAAVSGGSDPIGQDGNVAGDPLFCDPGDEGFGLDGDGSPAAPGLAPPECPESGIGMYGVECGVSPILPVSWGNLKTLYR